VTGLPGVFDLSGRTAVVTGAGSGIGRATARVLAGAGAAVMCADVAAGAVEETAKGIVDGGGRASARVADVTRKDDVDALVADAVDQFGRLDVMCNNAGIMHNAAVVDITEEDLDRVFAVNLKGVLFGCQAAVPVMVEQGSGSIVNLASAAIDVPSATIGVYSMAKAAVAQLTRVLATEVAPHGVRVNAVAPGFVVTGITSRHFTNADGSVDEERKEGMLGRVRKITPLGIVGEPEDIAWAIHYLASDASRFMTGQIVRPNGGAAMPW
jgi:3-oxoacyl-[acyl-carrier protein] reductase